MTEINRVYRIEELGDVEGIVLGQEPMPVPGATEIVVRMRAVSLNKRDLMLLDGTYPMKARDRVVPLSDGAGEVVAVGERVTRFAVGDRVMGGYWPKWVSGRIGPEHFDQFGATLDGMLAEHTVMDEQWAVAVPEGLSWAEAAALPCAGLTAWTSLTGGAPLRPGDTVLTLGTGALSLLAIQFAKLLGLKVIVTTSRAANAERLIALGADHVVDYAVDPDWSGRVRELTGGRGADLVVETVGPATIDRSVRASALYGQVVVLITRSATSDELTISSEAYASSLATIRREFVGNRDQLEEMTAAVAAHGLRPVIDRVFPFERARDAYRYYRGGSAFGKVVIELPGQSERESQRPMAVTRESTPSFA
ncbi:NAD(P)-dependent alcohol dehydrogenase [Nonomuraea sp. NBC_01738]|uniref:zinc-dependent alcohol dehydrogenase family protein n=1 Tax=Nonomuraea sp. NBC_01738 TaxID=2976003 RepID=UPI002E12675F|nr:NAD(P)-dependent alcohol dehydrogenase [Nonomuraea sp. NBC_01738]